VIDPSGEAAAAKVVLFFQPGGCISLRLRLSGSRFLFLIYFTKGREAVSQQRLGFVRAHYVLKNILKIHLQLQLEAC